MYFYFILFFCSLISQENTIIQNVSIEKYSEINKIPHVLLDVRTPEEYENEHIDKAININVKGEDFIEKVQEYSNETTLIIYCRTGKRSAKAAKILKELGYKKIFNLLGGYQKWKQFQKSKLVN